MKYFIIEEVKNGYVMEYSPEGKYRPGSKLIKSSLRECLEQIDKTA